MIKPLTSLRFIFALMVFAAHCYIIDPHFSHFLYKEGFVGVSFFFVLSGFIISYNYRDKLTMGRVKKRDFWVARFARVYPLHVLTLVVSILTGAGVVVFSWDSITKLLSSLFLVHSFVPDVNYFFSFNSPSWSLGCEQLFYMLFPFLTIWLNSRRKLVTALFLSAVLVFIGMWITPEEQIKAYWYVNPITRLPDFIVGMLLFDLFKNRQHDWNFSKATRMEVGAVLLFLGFYVAASAGYIPKVYRYSIYYWIPVSAMLYVFAVCKGAISKLLSNKYLVIGGDISFAIYLIHLFILSGYVKIGIKMEWQIAVPLLLIITIVLSLLSYYYFEKPINKTIKRLLTKK